MRIIQATLEHLDLLTPLFVKYREFYGSLPYPDSSRAFLEKRLRRKESVIYLALADDDPGNSARFPITLLIDKLPVEQLQHIRLGMSARLSIVIHHSEQSMVVPVSALQQVGDTTTVQFRESAAHPVQQLIVTPGRPTVEGVELFGVPSDLLRVYP